MTFLSLFSDKHGFVATEQRVFAADELQPLQQVSELAAQLNKRLAEQQALELQACEEATRQGYADGLAAGEAAATTQIAETLKQLHDRQQIALQEMQDNCAELAVDIVRKIAGQIKSDEWLLAQAQQAAASLLDQPSVKLRVHSAQSQAVRKRLDSMTTSGRQVIDQVIGDDAVPDDACFLETGQGQVQVDLETQLAAVLALFGVDETAERGNV